MQNLPDSASVWNNVGMCFFFGKKKYVAVRRSRKIKIYVNSKIMKGVDIEYEYFTVHKLFETSLLPFAV
jgi:hypothetical protein